MQLLLLFTHHQLTEDLFPPLYLPFTCLAQIVIPHLSLPYGPSSQTSSSYSAIPSFQAHLTLTRGRRLCSEQPPGRPHTDFHSLISTLLVHTHSCLPEAVKITSFKTSFVVNTAQRSLCDSTFRHLFYQTYCQITASQGSSLIALMACGPPLALNAP